MKFLATPTVTDKGIRVKIKEPEKDQTEIASWNPKQNQKQVSNKNIS